MEIWKPIRNFPSYNASSEGRIMNVRTQRIMKTFVNSKGYELVCLRKNNQQYTVKVHKLIADTFLGENPGLDISHKNGDKSDNRAENLKWSTRSEAIRDSFLHGRRLPPRRTRVRVIETNDIFETLIDCANAVGCDRTSISRCLAGKSEQVKGYHFEEV